MITLPEGYTARAALLTDEQAVLELLNAVSLQIVGEIEETLDDIRDEWTEPQFNLATQTCVILAPDGSLVGYAIVYDETPYDVVDFDVYSAISQWGINDWIEPYLLQWVEQYTRERMDRVAADLRVVLHAWTHAVDTRFKSTLESAGMIPIRFAFWMRIALDSTPPVVPLPDGLTLDFVREGEPWKPIYYALNEIWRDHWGFIAGDIEDEFPIWEHHWKADYVPDLWMIAKDGDRLAGMCLCKVKVTDDGTLGWVSNLGVVRDYRKRGLGEAMLRNAFARLHAHGQTRVGLGVDGGSLTNAVGLYERVGMHVHTRFDLYEKVLREGRDPRTVSAGE
jgi:mycothiol synthase